MTSYERSEPQGERTDCGAKIGGRAGGRSVQERSARGWLTIASLLMSGSCGMAPRQPPDVLLVSLDTLRGDVAWQEMPRLRAFSEGAFWSHESYSPIGFTLPAHASMLFGVGIESHLVLSEHEVVDPGYTSLAEQFAEHGYRTLAVVTNDWLKPRFGFDQGFEEYLVLPHSMSYADRVIDHVSAWLEQPRQDGRPLFVFAHFMDAHSEFSGEGTEVLPYWSAPELRRDLDVSRAEEIFCTAQGECASLWLMRFQKVPFEPQPGAVELARQLYIRGVRGLDRDLDRLWRNLEGNLDQTIVVVTADHGEEFLEHGRMFHSQPYQETLNVPWIIRADGRQPASPTAPAPFDLADVAPTLSALAGLAPASTWQGRDIFTSRQPRALLSRDKVFDRWSLRTARWSVLEALVEGDAAGNDDAGSVAARRFRDALYGPTSPGAGTTTCPVQVFDRGVDRAEQRNLLEELTQAQVDRLLQQLVRGKAAGLEHRVGVQGAEPGAPVPPLSEDERRQLEALGYLR